MTTEKPETKEISAATEVDNAILPPSVDDYVKRFGERFAVGLNAIAEAGSIYAEAIRKHPTNAQDAFSRKYPTVSDRTWNMLRAIGNGDLNPGAMLLLPKVADRVKKLTRKQQDALFRDSATGVKIINARNYSVETVDISNLTSTQLSIVLDEENGRLRSEEEQRAFLMKTMQNCARNVRGRIPKYPPYRIVGKMMYVGKVEIGIAEIKAILAAMEGSK